MNTRICFVIGPIGADGSETRKRSNRVLQFLIEPAASQCGYEVIRADKISSPGLITDQIIRHVKSVPMVVADLTEHNANAFYELAIRHMVKRPLVQIIRKGDPVPFDLAATRVLQIEDPDLENIEAAKAILIAHIKAAETEPPQNPISISTDLEALQGSTDPMRAQMAELSAEMSSMRSELAELKKRPPARGVRAEAIRSMFPEMFGKEPEVGGFEVGAGWGGEHFRKLTERVAELLTEEAAERLRKEQEGQKDK